MTTGFEEIQQRLQHNFADRALLQRALTHRSFSSEHYERLEFLGDAVLNLAVSDLLYTRLTAMPEGDLSRIRASLVCQDFLCRIAEKLAVSGLLRLGEGEARSGGRQRASILADAVEALIGAVYLDAGFAAARSLVWRLYADVEIGPELAADARDSKTALQEWLQARRMPLPLYHVVAVTGREHAQTFEVECRVEKLGLAERGTGKSRKSAERAAAGAMLAALGKEKP